jgi:hypothetical protein
MLGEPRHRQTVDGTGAGHLVRQSVSTNPALIWQTNASTYGCTHASAVDGRTGPGRTEGIVIVEEKRRIVECVHAHVPSQPGLFL